MTTHCENAGNYISFYPNPATGTVRASLRFKTDFRGKASMIVMNGAGQQITRQPATVVAGDNVIPVNTSTLPAGICYVRLIDGSGNYIGNVQKLIRQ